MMWQAHIHRYHLITTPVSDHLQGQLPTGQEAPSGFAHSSLLAVLYVHPTPQVSCLFLRQAQTRVVAVQSRLLGNHRLRVTIDSPAPVPETRARAALLQGNTINDLLLEHMTNDQDQAMANQIHTTDLRNKARLRDSTQLADTVKGSRLCRHHMLQVPACLLPHTMVGNQACLLRR